MAQKEVWAQDAQDGGVDPRLRLVRQVIKVKAERWRYRQREGGVGTRWRERHNMEVKAERQRDGREMEVKAERWR